jgi:hypothetical protein
MLGREEAKVPIWVIYEAILIVKLRLLGYLLCGGTAPISARPSILSLRVQAVARPEAKRDNAKPPHLDISREFRRTLLRTTGIVEL